MVELGSSPSSKGSWACAGPKAGSAELGAARAKARAKGIERRKARRMGV